MYTNGLKDRFGSPLISLDEADERYILQGDIEFQHKKIEEKIYETEKFIDDLSDRHFSLGNKMHYVTESLNKHIGDDSHFTEDEKKEYKEINELVLGVYPTFDFSTNKTTYTGETEARSIQLDKADFIPGGSVIQEIRLPYKNEVTNNNSEKYCHISVFDSNSTQIGTTFVSEGATSRTTGSNELLISKWSFDNIVLPDDYAFVRIALSPNSILTNLNGDSTFRINVSRNANNQNIIPTNLSKLLSSTQSYLGWVEVTAVSLERQNIKEEFTSTIDNLSTELRTQFGESLEGLRDDIGEDYLTKTEASENYLTKTSASETYVTKTEASETYATNDNLETNYYTKEESGDAFVTNEEFNELVKNTQQYYYDTWTNVMNQDSLNPASIKAFQYSKSDFVASRFDRIEFPFQAAGNTGYLCVQFFDSNSQVIENETYFSNNKFEQVGASSSNRKLTTFTFDEVYPPEDYAFVRFSFVAEKVAPATIADGLSIKAMYINRNGASWGSHTYLYNDSAAKQTLTIYITVLSRKAAKNTGITYRDYDWTPDFFNGVTVTMSAGGKAFVAPTNGWLISNPRKTTTTGNTITVNSIEFGYSSTTSQVPVQMLLRKGDVITSSHSYVVSFYPCKSEQHDYIPVNEHTPYDIWKGAVVYDANGEVSVRDLYVPDASAWKSEVGHAVIGSITRIEDEKAYDSNGNVLFNIQSQYIENGNYMFIQSSITSFDSDLGALTTGAQMFAGARLINWNTNLPSLTSGETMFYACPALASFNADVHSLTTGWNMFMNCSNLTTVSFVGGLDALGNAGGMFKGCSLSYVSLDNILNALPARNNNVIEITVADSVKDEMLSDPQFAGVSIPAHDSGNYYEFTHNGWKVRLTSRTGFDVTESYDITAQNGYVPDASAWYNEVGSGSDNDLDERTVSIENSRALDSNGNTLFNVDSANIENGSRLFANFTNLTSFNGDLNNLTNGYSMFNVGGDYDASLNSFTTNNLNNLTVGTSMFAWSNIDQFNYDLPNLKYGGGMFYHCTALHAWTVDLPNLIDAYILRESQDDTSTDFQHGMFEKSGLHSFSGDLSKLENGDYMFSQTWLGGFNSSLSSLSTGVGMFQYCMLNGDSVEKILTTIPTYTSGTHELTIHANQSFRSEIGQILGTSLQDTISEQTVSYKGWTIKITLHANN